jgi:hypothetical protein
VNLGTEAEETGGHGLAETGAATGDQNASIGEKLGGEHDNRSKI